jgi:hypothetical protein
MFHPLLGAEAEAHQASSFVGDASAACEEEEEEEAHQ